jgi:2-C-methyl-D-erythritol 4-phosphate cytidylyltransferase/2-C-methyl-D-erythritol 2,4-cyclodiphosphate synthase
MKRHIILLMAGKSTRMTLQKQSMLIWNQPVFSYALKEAKNSNYHPLITCVVSHDFSDEISDVVIVRGGETRLQSILFGLSSGHVDINDHVVIHDVARAGVLSEDYDKVFAKIALNEAVISVLPIHDACLNEANQILNEKIMRIVTPLGFVVTQKILDELIQHQHDSMPFVSILKQSDVHLNQVQGHSRLYKLTTDEDLEYMTWLLREHDES